MRAPGLSLRLWLALTAVIAPLARRHLERRLRRGKEDPARMDEKTGHASLPRPRGRLVWMHAVGVGEVLALPALARALQERRSGLSVLITSSSRTSAQALESNLPPGVMHQYLPLDARPFVRRFLDHWRPDLAVWCEQDLWPRLIFETDRRGIPLALVNGRMSEQTAHSRARAAGLYRDLLGRFARLSVQDRASAAHFAALGAPGGRIRVSGSLKAASAPLSDQPEARARLSERLSGRRVWIAASTHPGDEPDVAEAQKLLLQWNARSCLVVVPRDASRAPDICAEMADGGLRAELVGTGNTLPDAAFDTLVVGEMGQLGLWFRLADAAFVGGSIAAIGGHNPYEPARLDCAVLHGPNIGNFAEDYAAFHKAGAATEVKNGVELAEALADPDLATTIPAAAVVASRGHAALDHEADRLLELLR